MIESEARPQTEYWEPWQPRIGQRVRVRLSGECQARYPEGVPGWRWGTAHPLQFDGFVGVVLSEDHVRTAFGEPLVELPGHPYPVLFDRAVAVPPEPLPCCGAHFAAIELEPLE